VFSARRADLRITTIDEFPVNVGLPEPATCCSPSPGLQASLVRFAPCSGETTSTIASMQVWGRGSCAADAVMVASAIDDPIPPSLLAHIHTDHGIQEAHPVTL